VKILYVTPDIPWPPRVGGALRKWNVLQGLLQAGSVDCVVIGKRGAAIHSQSYANCGKVFVADEDDFALSAEQREQYNSTLGRGALVFSSTLPFEYQGKAHSHMREKLRKEVDFSQYDCVWFATARAAIPIGLKGANATVLDGDDYSYVREWLLLRTTPSYGAKLWNYFDVAKLWWWERGHVQRFSIVVRCSNDDRARHPGKNVVVIPNGTDVPAALNRRPQARALFVGDLGYEPNQHGVEWFLQNAWPLIRAQIPEAQIDLVGRNRSSYIEAANGRDGIHVHGFVEQIEPFFETAALSVVPLLSGGGTRLKIPESLVRGVPVVSTRVGAYGMEAGEEHGLYLADEPTAFAEKCIGLLADPTAAATHALAGREYVASIHDWRVIQQQVARAAAQAASTAQRGGGVPSRRGVLGA